MNYSEVQGWEQKSILKKKKTNETVAFLCKTVIAMLMIWCGRL